METPDTKEPQCMDTLGQAVSKCPKSMAKGDTEKKVCAVGDHAGAVAWPVVSHRPKGIFMVREKNRGKEG
jgi:hypothetical protein